MTGALHPLGSEVVKACLPRGQAKPFPDNCLSLMTVTGAKGSSVNFSQISALLGQQARSLTQQALPRANKSSEPVCLALCKHARCAGHMHRRFASGFYATAGLCLKCSVSSTLNPRPQTHDATLAQELEGQRVPRMASGKTLPCFAPFDPGARSGGFIADRFLTGLRPQAPV